MITPETIITAELLSGITACPFCGTRRNYIEDGIKEFGCGSSYIDGRVPSLSFPCLRMYVETLRARVSSLEAQVQRLIYAGDRLSNPFAVGENDIKAWTKAKEGV